MKTFISYIKNNFWRIFATLLASVAFLYLVVPYFHFSQVKNGLIKDIGTTDIVGYLSLFMLLAIVTWKKANNYWQRYLATHQLKTPPFVNLNYVILFVLFLSALALFSRSLVFFKLPSGLMVLLLSCLAVTFIWLISSLLVKQKPE